MGFDPVSLALTTASTVAGSVFSGISSVKSGKAEVYNAGYNAALEEKKGEVAVSNAAGKYFELRRRNVNRVSNAIAAIGESGFQISGSFKDQLDRTAEQGELDALAAIYEGGYEALSHKMNAKAILSGSKGYAKAGAYKAASDVIGGVFKGASSSGVNFAPSLSSGWNTQIVPTSA